MELEVTVGLEVTVELEVMVGLEVTVELEVMVGLEETVGARHLWYLQQCTHAERRLQQSDCRLRFQSHHRPCHNLHSSTNKTESMLQRALRSLTQYL